MFMSFSLVSLSISDFFGIDDATVISVVLHINFAKIHRIVKLSYQCPYYLVECLVW